MSRGWRWGWVRRIPERWGWRPRAGCRCPGTGRSSSDGGDVALGLVRLRHPLGRADGVHPDVVSGQDKLKDAVGDPVGIGHPRDFTAVEHLRTPVGRNAHAATPRHDRVLGIRNRGLAVVVVVLAVLLEDVGRQPRQAVLAVTIRVGGAIRQPHPTTAMEVFLTAVEPPLSSPPTALMGARLFPFALNRCGHRARCTVRRAQGTKTGAGANKFKSTENR